MKPSDIELAAVATELGDVAAKLLRDASSLARVASWLVGDRESCSVARIGGVLKRYSGQHRQAYSKEVAAIAVRLSKLAEGEALKPKRRPRRKSRRLRRIGAELQTARQELKHGDPRSAPEVRRLLICTMNDVNPARAAEIARDPGYNGRPDGAT